MGTPNLTFAIHRQYGRDCALLRRYQWECCAEYMDAAFYQESAPAIDDQELSLAYLRGLIDFVCYFLPKVGG